MKLYSYFRSSAAYRVRIALNLKDLPYDIVPVHLLKHGGEQLSPMYRKLNANGLVPTLVDDDTAVGRATLGQSLAIIEYLEETYPHVALLPKAPLDRAFVRSIALSIACDIHPVNNLRVLRYLVRDLKISSLVRDRVGRARKHPRRGPTGWQVLFWRYPNAGRLLFGSAGV